MSGSVRAASWAAIFAIPIILIAGGIEYLAYWTVPAFPVAWSGDPAIVYDPEIGFVPRQNSSAVRSETNGLQYHIHNDRRGARVSRSGDQTPEHVDMLFVGDSFTWGHGVENEETFAALAPKSLGVIGANVALGSYGTTQALQMLRRNLDLRPRVVVYTVISDHLRRNVSACSPNYYPFCFDASFVSGGVIRPPRTNGVRRTSLHIQYERDGLDPLAWLVHGADVILGRALTELAKGAAADPVAQDAALRFLLGEMAATTRAAGARLVLTFIPTGGNLPPAALLASARDLGVELIDLSGQMQPGMYLADGHPNAAGHRFIAERIAAPLGVIVADADDDEARTLQFGIGAAVAAVVEAINF